jgi:putative membrane protein
MCAMNKVAQVLAALEALTLIAVGVMEAFFYRSPELYAIFLIEPGEYDAVRLWTVNVGFYNIFMGVGLIVALLVFVNRGRVVAGRTIVLYTSALHVLLGITLVFSEPRLWVSAIGEAGLAAAVIVAVIIGDRRSRAEATPVRVA